MHMRRTAAALPGHSGVSRRGFLRKAGITGAVASGVLGAAEIAGLSPALAAKARSRGHATWTGGRLLAAGEATPDCNCTATCTYQSCNCNGCCPAGTCCYHCNGSCGSFKSCFTRLGTTCPGTMNYCG
jgi:hypothetical protein